ncbi:unnamed protein product [Mesocestoides corti]|uniref:Sodium/hydrogen exchanger n=1 Tax=Mesocestoides corti TaxID=53468 RepID=A0A0R3UGS4_MESCO|nr:unnamed protein product [Mesocestoides corti]
MSPKSVDSRYLLVDWATTEYRDQLSLLLLLLTTVSIKIVHSQFLASRFLNLLPESLLLICSGAIIGALMTYVLPENLDGGLWRITPRSFFHYLLPITVLDAAYHLYNRAFADTIVAVVVYAVFATVLNMILIGVCLIALEKGGLFVGKGVVFGNQLLFLYASFIVAVDPVAVLTIFHEIGVDPSLYYLALGESLFNDGVTLVLYKIVKGFLGVKEVTLKGIVAGIGAFLTISFGAILVGLSLGIIACLVTRCRSQFEVAFLLGIAYASYIVADVLGWSGLVALITCAMLQAAYAFHNLEESDLGALRCITRQLSELCEGIIFLLIGIKFVEKQLNWHFPFSLWSLLACLVVRALVVFLLTFGLNKFFLDFSTITFTDQFILAYGGLRGAVALSLAIMVDRKKVGQKVYDIFVTSTLFTILFTVGVMGPTMRPLVKVLHVKLAQNKTISLVRELNDRMIDEITAGVEAITGRYGRNSLRACFVRLDEDYIRGFLQRDPFTYNAGIVRVYEEMALVLHHASLQSPQRAATIMRNLPLTIQTRQFQVMDKEHRASRLEMRRVRRLSASYSLTGGLRRRRNARFYYEETPDGVASHRYGRFRRFSFFYELPRFLAAKKALVLKMSSQAEETSASGVTLTSNASEIRSEKEEEEGNKEKNQLTRNISEEDQR